MRKYWSAAPVDVSTANISFRVLAFGAVVRIGCVCIAVLSVSGSIRTPAQEDKVCKHVMKTYSYYQDVKCTVWERKHFTVNAASQQEADEIAKRCVVGNVHDQTDGNILALEEDETIYDTMDLFPLEENHGSPTIEVYRKDHKFIADNSPKR